MPLTHISKVSALTILALSIAACSSGGNHTKISPNTPPLTDQAAAQKIEANRLALLDKAKKAGLSAAQAAAYAEANKEASETDAQSALNTLVAEKAEADRIAAEKAAAEKAEADRIAAEKAEADRIAAEKAEADRIAAEKAEADRIAAEKAEAERLQKIEDNRLALLDKAKTAGLTDQQAADYAEANKQASETNAQNALDSIVAENERVALDNALYQAKGDYHNNPQYPVNQISAKTTSRSSSTINGAGSYAQSHEVVYNQPYSVVLGSYSSQAQTNRNGFITSQSMTPNITIKGLLTEANAIPTLGTATYSGKAFISEKNPLLSSTSGLYEEGSLSYNVNFSDRTGSGSITGLGDTVELQQGSISGTGISAVAQQGYRDGSYLLDFFGKKAEEIAGKVIFDGKDTIGFGGTRGEISKKQKAYPYINI